MAASCATCQFADLTIGDDDEPRIDCRRYPPTTVVDDEGLLTIWVQVRGDDWCGEFVLGGGTWP